MIEDKSSSGSCEAPVCEILGRFAGKQHTPRISFDDLGEPWTPQSSTELVVYDGMVHLDVEMNERRPLNGNVEALETGSHFGVSASCCSGNCSRKLMPFRK